MIGVGIDIVDISRMNRIIKSGDGAFVNRVFTKKEILNSKRFLSKAEYFSMVFSFKESFVKAIGSGFTDLARPADIEVSVANILPKVKAYFKKKRIDIRRIDFLTIGDNIICSLIIDNAIKSKHG